MGCGIGGIGGLLGLVELVGCGTGGCGNWWVVHKCNFNSTGKSVKQKQIC